MLQENIRPGGWTPYTANISPEIKALFERAIEEDDNIGVTYECVAVASQTVKGVNYSFFCNSRVVSPEATNEGAIIFIEEDLKGNLKITHREHLSHEGVPA